MSGSMRITLRAGERLFVNGAVLRASQKTTIEILNDATFLLEGHVLQPEDATTPLRQLYFTLQTILMEPSSDSAADAYKEIYEDTLASFSTTYIVAGLQLVGKLVEEGRVFEALKTIRRLYGVEEEILAASRISPPKVA